MLTIISFSLSLSHILFVILPTHSEAAAFGGVLSELNAVQKHHLTVPAYHRPIPPKPTRNLATQNGRKSATVSTMSFFPNVNHAWIRSVSTHCPLTDAYFLTVMVNIYRINYSCFRCRFVFIRKREYRKILFLLMLTTISFYICLSSAMISRDVPVVA